MQEIRIQIAVLHDDESASLQSWELSESDADVYREVIRREQGEPDESFYTVAGVEAIDEAVKPEHVIVL
jgi:hypothetical protein